MINQFDPEKSLFSLPLVRWIFYTTISIAGIVIALILFYDSKGVCFTGECFGEAIKRFQAPLGTLGVGLALIGLCGANHRSEQTKRQMERTAIQINLTTKQIDLTQGQNNFSNYYKHIEEFETYVDTHSNFIVEKTSARKLYGKIFDKSHKGDYGISESFLLEIDTFAKDVIYTAIDIDVESTSEDRAKPISKIIALRDEALNSLHLKYKGGGGAQEITNKDKETFVIPIIGKRQFFNEFVLIFTYIDEIMRFDVNHATSEHVSRILETDTSIIPSSLIINGMDRFKFPTPFTNMP